MSKLSCSLVGQEKKIKIVAGSEAHRIYGADEAVEVFACNYGLNEAFQDQIAGGELHVSGYGEDGTVRIVEWPGHPFYISTLFVPQALSQAGNPHPLIAAYLEAASRFKRL